MKFPVASTLAALSLLPCLPCLPGRAETPEAAPKKKPVLTMRSAVDGLSDAELDQVIRLLKDNYLKPEALAEADQRRATVQGLLDRLAPGAAIIEGSANGATGASPFRAEILDNRIGYARLG